MTRAQSFLYETHYQISIIYSYFFSQICLFFYWGEMVKIVAYLINQLPSSVLNLLILETYLHKYKFFIVDSLPSKNESLIVLIMSISQRIS